MIYNNFKKAVGSINWETDNIKAMLVDNTYAPNIDTETNITDIDALLVEISGAGYSAGGGTIAGKTITVDNALDLAIYDATDLTWSAATFTAKGAVIYDVTSGDLITYLDFGADKSATGGDFILQWHSSGVFRIG